MKRRIFVQKSLTASAALMGTGTLLSANPWGYLDVELPKISLAQWSLHRAFEKGDLNPENFAGIAMDEYQINAVEYVNAFYTKVAKNEGFWNDMRSRANDSGVKSLLIMVDNEGELGHPDAGQRKNAVENHIKWLEAAKLLNCHSIRVNAFGNADRDTLKSTLSDGLGMLASLGAELDIHVLVENHGLHTSDASFISDVIKQVDNKYLGTLPDFGNWCLNTEWGSTQGGKCTDSYDPYKGVEQLLPFAKGVSAKSYDFDESGNETTIDFKKMLHLVKNSGFDGYIGIEYEGGRLSEAEGIRATKSLIRKIWKGN